MGHWDPEALSAAFATIEAGLAGGHLGIAFVSHTGLRGGYRAEDVFPTASSIKIAIVAALEGRFQAGQRQRESVWDWKQDELIAGSGVLAKLRGPATLCLDDLATLALVISDNTASNICLAASGGTETVNAWLADCGATSTRVHRPIRFALEPDDPPHTATGTPADFLKILNSLPPAVWERMSSCSTSFLARFLDVNPYAQDLRVQAPEFQMANKPGAVDGVRNDVGRISWSGGHVDIAVMTCGVPDRRWTPENNAEIAVGLAARAVLENLGVFGNGEMG